MLSPSHANLHELSGVKACPSTDSRGQANLQAPSASPSVVGLVGFPSRVTTALLLFWTRHEPIDAAGVTVWRAIVGHL